MLGWLRKRKYTFTKEDGLKSIGTTKETNIDFKEYFYDESNKYFQLQEVVQENLESYTPEEIERLAADVLFYIVASLEISQQLNRKYEQVKSTFSPCCYWEVVGCHSQYTRQSNCSKVG
ncbi:hypothetical protein [Cytobacillus firmus]